MIDISDVPPPYAPVVIAQAAQAKQASARIDRTIGVCHLIVNPAIPPTTAVNSLSPALSVLTYFERRERVREQVTADVYNAAKISILQGPAHGELRDEGVGEYRYHPTSDYHGQDRATLFVEIGSRKVKVVYSFNVMQRVPGGNDAYDPYEDKKLCPKGIFWKISLNSGYPNGGLISFQYLK